MKQIKIPSLLLKSILLLYFICNNCFACDSLQELRTTFKIENPILTSSTNQPFSRYPYESKLHFDLYFYTKDPKSADTIYTAYKNHILPIIYHSSNESSDAFSKALIEVCLLFGNPSHSPEKPFLHALNHQGKEGCKWIDEFPHELRAFIEEANKPTLTVKNIRSDIFTVAIITTTASGGNHAVAESIAGYLATHPHIKPILINVEDVAKEVDPVMIATGTYTYDMIYSHIFQKTNDFSVIPGRKKLSREIQEFIPNTLLMKLKERVAQVNPDLIISTRSYTCDDIALASLGVPFRLYHPDFELCPSLCSYYRNVPADSIRFWIPEFRSSMFRPLFESFGHLELYDEKENYSGALEKIAHFLNVPFADFKAQFEFIGFPCLHFYQIQSESKLQELRRKWDIEKNEVPIFIVMGKHGTCAIRQIFDELLQSNTHTSFKYLFICGKNVDLQEELKHKLHQSQSNKNKFVILGLLTPEEMNEIMNISSLGISKAGGATVMESIATNRPLLLMHSAPWEEINASYLIEMKLAMRYEPALPLVNQIAACIQTCQSNSEETTAIKNWRNHLMSSLEKHSLYRSELANHRSKMMPRIKRNYCGLNYSQ